MDSWNQGYHLTKRPSVQHISGAAKFSFCFVETDFADPVYFTPPCRLFAQITTQIVSNFLQSTWILGTRDTIWQKGLLLFGLSQIFLMFYTVIKVFFFPWQVKWSDGHSSDLYSTYQELQSFHSEVRHDRQHSKATAWTSFNPLSHTPLCISMISGVCVQGMWNAQVKGQVTETHRLKVNSHCDTALFISMYDITMVQPWRPLLQQ